MYERANKSKVQHENKHQKVSSIDDDMRIETAICERQQQK